MNYPHARPDGLVDTDDMESLRTLGELTQLKQLTPTDEIVEEPDDERWDDEAH